MGLDIVEEVWDIIFQDYVEKDNLDAGKLSQGAISGMVEMIRSKSIGFSGVNWEAFFPVNTSSNDLPFRTSR